MSGINPQGCQVFSFQHPSDGELKHDFLWRYVSCLPERGRIGIFNRSYYEEVLIVRVHPKILQSEGVPGTSDQVWDQRYQSITALEQHLHRNGTRILKFFLHLSEEEQRKRLLERFENPAKNWKLNRADLVEREFWLAYQKDQRYQSITALEQHLHRNGTRILKFFLHLSEEEQRKRLLERFENPAKNWKLNRADLAEREFWPAYQKAYEACISATSTEESPWYVVPADDKENARLIISQIILGLFKRLDLRMPIPDKARKKELQSMRDALLEPKRPS